MNMEELEESIGELAATVQDQILETMKTDCGVDDQILETMKTDFDGEIDCFIGLLGWAFLLSLSHCLSSLL